MSGRNGILESLRWVVSSAPYILVLLAGLFWSLTKMNRYPKPALLAATGAALLLANAVLLTFVQDLGVQLMLQERSQFDLSAFLLVSGFLRSLISAAGIGCLLTACFVERKESSSIPFKSP